MYRITINTKNFEALKSGNKIPKSKKAAINPVLVATGVGLVAGTVLELASRGNSKVGKSANLIKELVRIFSV